MSKTDKAKLAEGAEAIRKAEREAKRKALVRLDGTIDGVEKEIIRLHGEIELAQREARDKAQKVFRSFLKPSVPKVIREGELLCRVKASKKHGTWLPWLKRMPFSQRTAWNYMECYKRGDELTKLANADSIANLPVTEAYQLLPPKRKRRPNKAVRIA
jgi:hypothetical protein